MSQDRKQSLGPTEMSVNVTPLKSSDFSSDFYPPFPPCFRFMVLILPWGESIVQATMFLSITIVVIVLLLTGLRISQEYQRGVIFRLGRYSGLRGPGLFWIIPLAIERAVIIDIRTRTVSAEQQETITRDSVTIKVNAVLWYRIVDPAKSVIAVSEAPDAVYQLALTSLRNIIGQHDLDDVLRERDKINGLLRENIVGSTVAWGVEVERFEMKDVELP